MRQKNLCIFFLCSTMLASNVPAKAAETIASPKTENVATGRNDIPNVNSTSDQAASKQTLTIEAVSSLTGQAVKGNYYQLIRYNEEKQKYGSLVEYKSSFTSIPSNGYLNLAGNDGGFSVAFLKDDHRNYRIRLVDVTTGYKMPDWEYSFSPAADLQTDNTVIVNMEPISGQITLYSDSNRSFLLLEYNSVNGTYSYVSSLNEISEGTYTVSGFYFTEKNQGQYRVDAIKYYDGNASVSWSQELFLEGNDDMVFSINAPSEQILDTPINQIIEMS